MNVGSSTLPKTSAIPPIIPTLLCTPRPLLYKFPLCLVPLTIPSLLSDSSIPARNICMSAHASRTKFMLGRRRSGGLWAAQITWPPSCCWGRVMVVKWTGGAWAPSFTSLSQACLPSMLTLLRYAQCLRLPRLALPSFAAMLYRLHRGWSQLHAHEGGKHVGKHQH